MKLRSKPDLRNQTRYQVTAWVNLARNNEAMFTCTRFDEGSKANILQSRRRPYGRDSGHRSRQVSVDLLTLRASGEGIEPDLIARDMHGGKSPCGAGPRVDIDPAVLLRRNIYDGVTMNDPDAILSGSFFKVGMAPAKGFLALL